MRETCGINRNAFTLVEMLVVISIISILSVLATSALSGIKESEDFNMAIGQISGVLDQARAYAMAKNTYVFVGFTEANENSTSTASPEPAGVGRVVIVTMASQDGTRGFDTGNSWNYNSGSNLVLVNKPLYLNNVDLPGTQETAIGNMARPVLTSTANDFINGVTSTETPLTFPLGAASGSGQYSFNHVVYFDPAGAAHFQPTSTTHTPNSLDPYLEIDLQPSHGNSAPTTPPTTGDLVAIQIDSMTGAIRVYRP